MSEVTQGVDDGAVEMMIFHEDGKVIVRYQHPMSFVVFEPQNAIDVARYMTDMAFEARDGVKPAGDTLKAELIEQHRMKLTQRIALMLGTMRNEFTVSDGRLAQQLVEVCLREIF